MIKNRINQFLTDQQFGAHRIDMQKEMGLFLLSMEEGLRGSSAGMEMIPTWLTLPKTEVVNEKVIVMDMGGSNVRVAVACFDSNGAFTLEKFAKYPMPGSDEPCTKAEFRSTWFVFCVRCWGKVSASAFVSPMKWKFCPTMTAGFHVLQKKSKFPRWKGS